MERKRFSVLFFIKRSKLLKNGEAPVRVRVTYDRLYVELQLKRSVKVPLWSQEKEKSTGKDRNSVELNHYIDALRVKFYQIYQDLELEGKIISARAIVNRYQGKDETFKTLYNVFKEHNDNCRKLIGTDYADITVRRYDNCLKYLMELVKRDYKVDDMLLREVNGELVRKFDLYLKTEKHCAQNTVIRYMKCFKKVINLAIANEWLTKNPFAGIKFHEVEVNKQFLSQAEINRIWQKEFRIERLELVRDVPDLRVKVRESRVGADIVFAVDASGSMGAARRMKEVKEAVLSMLMDSYQKRDQVGLVAFRGGEAAAVLELTRSVELAQRELQALPTGGRTPLAAGLEEARRMLERQRRRVRDSLPLLVLITDGRANFSRGGDPVEEALRAARRVAEAHIPAVVIDTERQFVSLGLAAQVAQVLYCVAL